MMEVSVYICTRLRPDIKRVDSQFDSRGLKTHAYRKN